MHVIFIFVFAAMGTLSYSTGREYKDYDHRFYVEYLRSGNHAQTKDVTYGLDWSLNGRCKTNDLSPVERVSKLANIKAKPLTVVDGVAELLEQKIDAEQLRTFTAETMQKTECAEADVLVTVKLELYVRGKWLYFFGEDTKVAEFSYSIFPDDDARFEERTHLSYPMQDDKGFSILFKVEYESPKS